MTRTRRLFVVIVGTFGCALGVARAAEDEPKPQEVKQAIARGAAWLKEAYQNEEYADRKWHDPTELLVLTWAHAEVSAIDPAMAKALKTLEKTSPRWTYRAALQAMALSEVNPRLYQEKIAHCAQWIVDTQLAAGEWGYPGPPEGSYLKSDGVLIAPPPRPEGEEGTPWKPREKVPIARKVPASNYGAAKGDFSNTQFAILGLRAAREAGIEVPKETWTGALQYLKSFQQKDGSWGYVLGGTQDDAGYSSLTCAGVCSVAICLHALGAKDAKEIRADASVKRGLDWLSKHLDLERNAGIDKSAILGPRPWQYYHLYSLERAARVLGLTEVANRAWYPKGAKWILAQQDADGSWVDVAGAGPQPFYFRVADTCFAILFLSRATKPLTGS